MEEKALQDLWSFDWTTKVWTEVACSGDVPEARSFHQMISSRGKLFCFGGCSVDGRLNDLHSFDPKEAKWTKLPTFDKIKGRGGAVFKADPVGHALYVIAGFAGEETSDVYKFDTMTESWTELPSFPSHIAARSVMTGCTVPSMDVICVFGGELTPSARGHEGAGNFSNDVLCLSTVDGSVVCASTDSEKPIQRGWLDSALVEAETDSEAKIAIFGGLSGNDEDAVRNNDTWIYQVKRI